MLIKKHVLRLLSTNNKNILYHLEGKIGQKCTHNNVQNEIFDAMVVMTLQEKLKTIRERRFFSIIADESTDMSNKEQLSFCLRSLDENLNAFEYLLGFYQLENIQSDTMVHVIKYILIRMNLSLSNFRSQTYDGALNMIAKKSGVSTEIILEQPKTVVIH